MMKKPLFNIAPIGMRIIKTTIAVFICALIGYFRGELPFYSMIAAVLCLQQDAVKSVGVAVNRSIGTLIGGLFGYLILLFVKAVDITPYTPFYYAIVSFCVIPLIYITILIKRTPAAYITCVVFFSITISHITDEIPALFVLHRIEDTLIGIFVALAINFLIPPKKQ